MAQGQARSEAVDFVEFRKVLKSLLGAGIALPDLLRRDDCPIYAAAVPIHEIRALVLYSSRSRDPMNCIVEPLPRKNYSLAQTEK